MLLLRVLCPSTYQRSTPSRQGLLLSRPRDVHSPLLLRLSHGRRVPDSAALSLRKLPCIVSTGAALPPAPPVAPPSGWCFPLCMRPSYGRRAIDGAAPFALLSCRPPFSKGAITPPSHQAALLQGRYPRSAAPTGTALLLSRPQRNLLTPRFLTTLHQPAVITVGRLPCRLPTAYPTTTLVLCFFTVTPSPCASCSVPPVPPCITTNRKTFYHENKVRKN